MRVCRYVSVHARTMASKWMVGCTTHAQAPKELQHGAQRESMRVMCGSEGLNSQVASLVIEGSFTVCIAPKITHTRIHTHVRTHTQTHKHTRTHTRFGMNVKYVHHRPR